METAIEISQLEREVSELVTTATAFQVTNTVQQSECQRLTIEATRRIRIAENFFKPIKQAQDAAKRVTLEQEKKIVEPLKQVKTILAQKDMAYANEQKRIADIEAQRIEAEQTRAAQESNMQAALELEAAGFQETADAVMNAPVEVAPVYVPPATVKETGISYRDNWSAAVLDTLELCKHVAAHPECVNYILPNTVALNQLAKAMKQALNIPGVKAVNNPIQSVKA